GPIEPRPQGDGPQINEKQLRAIVRIESNQQISGMQIVVPDTEIVHTRQEVCQSGCQTLSKRRASLNRQCGPGFLQEGVEGQCVFQGTGDEETGAGPEPRLFFAKSQRREGGHSTAGNLQSIAELGAGFRGPNQLAEPGPQVWNRIMLQIKTQLRQDDLVDGAMAPVFDDTGLTVLQPFLQAQTVWSKQRLPKLGHDLPANRGIEIGTWVNHHFHPGSRARRLW